MLCLGRVVALRCSEKDDCVRILFIAGFKLGPELQLRVSIWKKKPDSDLNRIRGDEATSGARFRL